VEDNIYTGDDVEESPTDEETQDNDVLVIPRVFFNYVVIAATFLVIGIVIGAILFRVLGTTEIDEAKLADIVHTAVADATNTDTTAEDVQQELDVNGVYDISTDGDPALGASAEDALVTVVEFSDFRCSYCGRFAAETLPQLVDTYGDKVRFVYRDYPQFGYLSYRAALAAECANDQGEFWPYHNLLFANASTLSDATFPEFAEQMGLDMDQFNECMANETHQTEIETDFYDGQANGRIGTPTFFINGKPLVGAQPYLNFVAAIDEALAEAGDEPAKKHRMAASESDIRRPSFFHMLAIWHGSAI
jgi:protein-disulfide isomerase